MSVEDIVNNFLNGCSIPLNGINRITVVENFVQNLRDIDIYPYAHVRCYTYRNSDKVSPWVSLLRDDEISKYQSKSELENVISGFHNMEYRIYIFHEKNLIFEGSESDYISYIKDKENKYG